MKRALVVALNPAVDAEWRVGPIHWDEKNTIHSETRWAGGKGVNVARWLAHLGGSPRLLITLGGASGAEVAMQLHAAHVSTNIIRVSQPTRVNVMVTQPAGPQLRFNPPGPRLTRAEWRDVFTEAEQEHGRCALQLLSGALPRDASPTVYRRLIQLARRSGVETVLDCDGPALAAGVGARPFLVKPNEHELSEWAGRPLRTDAAVRRAALAMSVKTGGWVLVSRAARGAMLVNAGLPMVLVALAPAVSVLNTVGAGDALVAAAALQRQLGASPTEWLRWGVAAGTAAAQTRAGVLAPIALVARTAWRVTVREA